MNNKSLKPVFSFLIFSTIYSSLCFSQDLRWWNEKHNWDGITPWENYLILSSGFMGPNALPVPEIKNGSLQRDPYLKFSIDQHFSKGDKTQNVFTELYCPLFGDRVGLNINVIPVEHFRMSSETRDKRRSRGYSGKGLAGGDIYVGTYIQLFRDKGKMPDMLLTINLRTASGTNLENARYTDTPGYFFDLSIGKKIGLKKKTRCFIRPYTLFGLYVWQLHKKDQYQNDAFLFGIGTDFQLSKIDIKNSIGGYIGYIKNGDRPILYRFSLLSKFDKLFNYELSFQQGLHDFGYSSIRISTIMNLARIKKAFVRKE